MRTKNWIELSPEILYKRYSNFLKSLWHCGASNLSTAKLFRNKENSKEKLIIGKKVYVIKLKKNKKNG